jgi:thiol-disulfide isomerase/thioredoxin
MGKASRSKRERHDGEDDGDAPSSGGGSGGSSRPITAAAPRKEFPFFWATIAVIVVGGLVALVLTRPDASTNERTDAAKDVPVYADVEIDGDDLVTWSGSGTDTAVGDPVPTISGTSTKNKPLTLAAGDGTAYVYSVMAHWCPHCNAEVPRIVDWANDGNLPDGVEIVGVSTSADKGQPNFPPATWLAKENWTYPTIIDDELGTASDALGTSGFPNLVFVDVDGKVVERFSGEMPEDKFDAAVQKIAPKSDAKT